MDVENEKMNLSIKALTPAPEGVSRPRREKKAEEENGGEDKQRKPRREKTEDEGPREWNEGGLGGVSLSDLINKD